MDEQTTELGRAAETAIEALGRHAGQYDADALRELLGLQWRIDKAALDAVIGLRARDYTWEQIGAVTRTTKQAAILRWRRRFQEGDVLRREMAYERDEKHRRYLETQQRRSEKKQKESK
jgi:hypothetical protein